MNIEDIKSYRQGQLELRVAHTLAWKGKPSVAYAEIVLWYPNGYYGNKDKYEEESGHPGFYKLKNPAEPWQNTIAVHEGCFKNPESCYTICSFDNDDEDTPDCRIVGSRFTDLTPRDQADCIDCMKEFYKQWKELYYNSEDYD